jgi:hypothetical protein
VIVRGDDQEIRGFFFNGLDIIIEYADVRVGGNVSRKALPSPINYSDEVEREPHNCKRIQDLASSLKGLLAAYDENAQGLF